MTAELVKHTALWRPAVYLESPPAWTGRGGGESLDQRRGATEAEARNLRLALLSSEMADPGEV